MKYCVLALFGLAPLSMAVEPVYYDSERYAEFACVRFYVKDADGVEKIVCGEIKTAVSRRKFSKEKEGNTTVTIPFTFDE